MDEIAQETKRAMSFYIQKAVELYCMSKNMQIYRKLWIDWMIPPDPVISIQEMRTKLEL